MWPCLPKPQHSIRYLGSVRWVFVSDSDLWESVPLNQLDPILKLVDNPDTDMALLIQLAEHGEWLVRARIAENPRLSADTLDMLSRDRDYIVRRRVAQNPNTQTETLIAISHDELNIVTQRYVHQHPNAPFGRWILRMRVIP